jgi:hypothetical protein
MTRTPARGQPSQAADAPHPAGVRVWQSGVAAEERVLDPVEQGGHIHEVNSDIAWNDDVDTGPETGRAQAPDAEVRVRPARTTGVTADLADRRVTREADDVEEIVHGAPPSSIDATDSTNPEGQAHIAVGALVERVEIEGALALVAQQFDQRGAPLFQGRLQLAVIDAEQMHLQRLDQEILGIPAIGTRQRQNCDSVRPMQSGQPRVYRIPPDRWRPECRSCSDVENASLDMRERPTGLECSTVERRLHFVVRPGITGLELEHGRASVGRDHHAIDHASHMRSHGANGRKRDRHLEVGGTSPEERGDVVPPMSSAVPGQRLPGCPLRPIQVDALFRRQQRQGQVLRFGVGIRIHAALEHPVHEDPEPAVIRPASVATRPARPRPGRVPRHGGRRHDSRDTRFEGGERTGGLFTGCRVGQRPRRYLGRGTTDAEREPATVGFPFHLGCLRACRGGECPGERRGQQGREAASGPAQRTVGVDLGGQIQTITSPRGGDVQEPPQLLGLAGVLQPSGLGGAKADL